MYILNSRVGVASDVDIKLKRSHTHSNIPTTSDLIEGEFAVNTYDRKMYMRDGSNEIVTVGNHYATDYESATKILYVTVATSTTDHPYHGTGSSNKYKINGIFTISSFNSKEHISV